MDTKKVIVTLLVLTIILSVLTVALTLTSSSGSVVKNTESSGQATVAFYVGENPDLVSHADANVGLYVSS